MREKIRTPDTLVRSQVLYPAELRTRMAAEASLLQQSLFYIKAGIVSSTFLYFSLVIFHLL